MDSPGLKELESRSQLLRGVGEWMLAIFECENLGSILEIWNPLSL